MNQQSDEGVRKGVRCEGQGVRKGDRASMPSSDTLLSQHLHVFTNPESP